MQQVNGVADLKSTQGLNPGLKALLDTKNPLVQRALIREHLRRAEIQGTPLFSRQAQDIGPDQLEFFLKRGHEKQQLLWQDSSRFIALLCPRRTGKTTATLFLALITDLKYPGSTIYYVVPDSKAHAQDLFWRPFEEVNSSLKLGLTFKIVEKRIITPRGTHIVLLAAHDKDSPARLRGPAVSLCIMDECKDFGPHFEELIIEAVLPSLGDYGGQLVLAGTPGKILAGVFYTVTEKRPEGWSVHKWVKSDNMFLRPEERDLVQVEATAYKPFGLDRNSPKFRREQLAEWVPDDLDRLYQYEETRNGWDGTLPAGHEWFYVMGVDFGERDANAFVVGCFSNTDPHLYILEHYSRSHMTIDEIAEQIDTYRRKYGEFIAIVGDSGGYGRGILTDLQLRKQIPITEADKSGNKLGNIAQMNSDFLTGRIKAVPGTELTKEWYRVVRRLRHDGRIKLTHSDLGDAALYMWRASQHWAAGEVTAEPDAGTPQYWQKKEAEDIRKYEESLKREWWNVCED